ncbi:MAG: hypothetical protein DMG67_03100 [Acidobacteria bacterium]|nr:MAG: hypothetical protein DMG67_03100 [Acidobacteriota bacterium]
MSTERGALKDMALIKLAVSPESEARVRETAGKHGTNVVENGTDSVILEFTGTKENIDSFVEIVRP